MRWNRGTQANYSLALYFFFVFSSLKILFTIKNIFSVPDVCMTYDGYGFPVHESINNHHSCFPLFIHCFDTCQEHYIERKKKKNKKLKLSHWCMYFLWFLHCMWEAHPCAKLPFDIGKSRQHRLFLNGLWHHFILITRIFYETILNSAQNYFEFNWMIQGSNQLVNMRIFFVTIDSRCKLRLISLKLNKCSTHFQNGPVENVRLKIYLWNVSNCYLFQCQAQCLCCAV